MTNPIEVSQRAREMAGTAWVGWRGKSHVEDEIMAIIEGKNDCHPLAQAFARFEAEIRADERERAVKVADQRVQLLHDLVGPMAQMRVREASLIATAIRNQKDHDHE